MPNTKIPGPKGSFFTGNLKEARERPLEFALELTRNYGDVSQIRIGPFPMVVLNHPDHIERVLRTEKKKYGKPAMVKMLRDLVGDGLLFSEGDRWLRQRRIMQPVFHRARIAAFGVVMAEAITRRIEAWRALPEGQALNLTEEAARLIFEVVGRCLFSRDLGGEAKELGEAIQFTLRWLDDRSQNPVALPLFVPTRDNRRFRAAQRLFKETTSSMIAERRKQEATGDPLPSDLLSMLLEAKDAETGAGMSDQELHEELFVFLVAGYETTAAALEWTMMLLAQHPEEQDAIFEEHRIICGKNAPRSNQIRELVRARQVIDESLRLYPPAFGLTRQAVEEDEVGGYRIKKGTQVLLSTYAMHRHPGFWEEPDRFDPDRFSEARSEGRPRYAYFPFGGGQRICIGQAFASMELAIFVPTMCSAFRFALAEEADCTPQPRMTLRPRGPMWMLLTPR